MRRYFVLAALALPSCTPSTEAIEPDTLAPIRFAPREAGRREPRIEPIHLGMQAPDPSPRSIARLQYSECEPGQTRACQGPSPSVHPLVMHCRATSTGALAFDRSDCATPLVLAFGDESVAFTSPRHNFAVGPFERTEWVSARTPWLGQDTDGSGCLEGQHELFGADEGAKNGFEKLARLDFDHDGRLDEHDPSFRHLVLWFDRNQDKRCDPSEIASLAEARVLSIDLAWTSSRSNLVGSHEGEHATIELVDQSSRLKKGRVVDVYLAPLP